MNSPTLDVEEREPGWSDHARLLAAAAICGVLAVCVFPFEHPILSACNVTPGSSALGFWDWLDRVAPPVFMTLAVVAGVALLFRGAASSRARRGGFALMTAFLVALVIVTTLKNLVGRDRPLADPSRWVVPLWSPLALADDRSFPSGHVAGATAICAAFWLALPRRWPRNAVWLVPPMMMFDRMCLAVHWPSDVLGGAAIGLASAAAVGWAAYFVRVDHMLGSFGNDGSPRARLLLVALAWLGITRIWLELPLGRDPVSGEVVPGFVTQPHLSRVLLEPILGPALHLALEDLHSILWPSIAWTLVTLAVVAWAGWRAHRSVRILVVAVFLLGGGIAVFLTGIAKPDRFVATDRTGVFVDWHLHGGDPFDGGLIPERQISREHDRGVTWPAFTHHSRIGKPWLRIVQFGVSGTEWSGPLPARGDKWKLPHVLMIGGQGVLERANETSSVLEAARLASEGGALMVVAHDWRSRATIPDCPSFEEYAAAGVHGFEVGNRRRETDPAALGRLRELDRKCREKGLLRFSFSDDHGIPAGSPCVTFLEGVQEAELRAEGGGAAILAKLRSPGHGGINVIPLLFHPGDSTFFPPRWLAPPAIAFEYFRSLRLSQRASWLAWIAWASLWVFRPRAAQPSPAPTVRSS